MKNKNYAFISLVWLFSTSPYAANFLNQTEGNYQIKDFRFHDGRTIDNLTIHYTTIGNPKGKPVLVLHGTTGNGKSMLNKSFGEALFAKGMPLDASKYFIILPDSIGTGESSKPSDGLKGNFPEYTYQDAVNAQYALVKNKLGIDHLYLILGNSMGGMQAWVWATDYPDYAMAIVPMAATPIPMSSRNWIMRKMVIDAIKNDPDWKKGFYDKQPEKFQPVYAYYNIISNGGDIAWQNKASTTKVTEEILSEKLKTKVSMDANDFMYQWNSARDFDPSSKLKNINSYIFAINAEDDERNLNLPKSLEKSISEIKQAHYYIIPASDKTSGHATTMNADLWKQQLEKFIEQLPQ